MLAVGIDLAWGEGSPGRPPHPTGVAAVDDSGQIVAAGWTVGVEQTLAWIDELGATPMTVIVDAPLVVTNGSGARQCERDVARTFGRWHLAARPTNLSQQFLAGLRLRNGLELRGILYDDGWDGPGAHRTCLEGYPHATLLAADEFGHPNRPVPYKRRPDGVEPGMWARVRAEALDGICEHLKQLVGADPPLELGSHPTTAALADPCPIAGRNGVRQIDIKAREDLIDAVICAWTALLWHTHGLRRCQVLGPPRGHPDDRPATIITPRRED